ncbi:MAG: sulfatase-like hydrolase/transferase, partial [Chloroflexi bacterium]|nr:sulfatase-like hydrolase/transferase [Chloroflexota bacterium]
LTSPHLDRFAASGAVFEECFSTHIPTAPAHTSMMTGRDPFETGVIAQGGKVEPDASVLMLAQRLQSEGYFTAAADNLGRWFSRGFELYEGYQWAMAPGEPWRKAEAVNETALRVLDRCASQDRPFFAFFHYWDPHTPYAPPPPFDRMFYAGNEHDPANPSMDKVWEFEPFSHYFAEWLPGVTDIQFPIALYDGAVAYLDSCLAQLFTRLEHLRLLEDTCVVITADHGEELDEHGCWFDHHGLYDTNIHVPLIIRCPGRTQPGQRVRGFVRTLDITPSILELIGLSPLNEPGIQGASFAPLLDSESAAGTCDGLFLTECTWMRKRAYRSRHYKYIQALEPDLHGLPPEELYDLQNDPDEKINLADSRPEVAAGLRARLEGWAADRRAASGHADPLEQQSIALHRIGNPETPVPRRTGR